MPSFEHGLQRVLRLKSRIASRITRSSLALVAMTLIEASRLSVIVATA